MNIRGKSGAKNSGPLLEPILVWLPKLMPSLSSSERLVARYVFANARTIIHLPIAETQRNSGACIDAIMHFCRRFGLNGYTDLKITLARELGRADLFHAVSQQKGSPLETVFRSYAQTIREMAQIELSRTFECARKALAKAKRVELFSTGSSFPVAYMAFCKFKVIGLPAIVNFDSHVQIDAATQLGKDDVAFGVSCSEAARGVVNCLKTARANGATTIYLTKATKAPTSKFADILLCAPSSKVLYSTQHFDSCLGQLAMIDVLVEQLRSS